MRRISIEKRDKMMEDGFKGIMEDYVLECRKMGESPNLKGVLGYLDKEGLIDSNGLIERIIKRKSVLKSPMECIKEMVKYGISESSLWNVWNRMKKI